MPGLYEIFVKKTSVNYSISIGKIPTERVMRADLGSKNNVVSLQNRSLMLACQRVSETWFPASRALLNKIRGSLNSGSCDLDASFLVEEIKGDFALFTYCLRELSKLLKEERVQPPQAKNAVDLLVWAGPARLKKILLSENAELSNHRLEDMNDVQAIRLQESLISASAAQALSEASEINSDEAYSAALFRQLGLTLVAWNYPKVYRRVFLAKDRSKDLDAALARELGFSPELLGLAIARQWQLSPATRKAIGDIEIETPKSFAARDIDNTGAALAKICEVGEALARANSPEFYPTAKADWESARGEIEAKLGAAGLKLIQTRFQANCQNYLSAAPETFKKKTDINPEHRFHALRAGAAAAVNKYLKDCPEPVQKILKEIYASITDAQISKEAILRIANEAIPAAGFSGGCIYLLEPERMTLAPRLKIGDSKLSDFAELSLQRGQSSLEPIAQAYNSNAPLLARIDSIDGGHFAAGALGINHRAGVLYLELSPALSEDPNAMPLRYFKALNQALMDCLRLS